MTSPQPRWSETLATPGRTNLEVGVGGRWVTTVTTKTFHSGLRREKGDLGSNLSGLRHGPHTNSIGGTPGTLAWLHLKRLTTPFYPEKLCPAALPQKHLHSSARPCQ